MTGLSLRNRALAKLSHNRLVNFLTLFETLILFIKFEKSNILKGNCPKFET